MTYNDPPTVWREFPYIPVAVPGRKGGFARINNPAITVRIRPSGSSPHDPSVPAIPGRGMLDSGAAMSVVPLWAIRDLKVPVRKESKYTMYSVSGSLDVYEVDVSMEMRYGSRWLDLGVIRVVAPDTEWSRDPDSRRPFLLGLGGFFDRFDVSISHAKRLFWLGKVGHWPGEGRP